MSVKFTNLRPLDFNERRYAENPYHYNNPKQRPLRDILKIEPANIYDRKWLEDKEIPTALEFTTHKNFCSPEEYQKIQRDPAYQKARTMAYVHQFLFELSFLPFIKIPFRDYNG